MDYEGRNGSAWYEAEAYRSVSQAAGRLLRHQADYGALLLLDGTWPHVGRPPGKAHLRNRRLMLLYV